MQLIKCWERVIEFPTSWDITMTKKTRPSRPMMRHPGWIEPPGLRWRSFIPYPLRVFIHVFETHFCQKVNHHKCAFWKNHRFLAFVMEFFKKFFNFPDQTTKTSDLNFLPWTQNILPDFSHFFLTFWKKMLILKKSKLLKC